MSIQEKKLLFITKKNFYTRLIMNKMIWNLAKILSNFFEVKFQVKKEVIAFIYDSGESARHPIFSSISRLKTPIRRKKA